MEAGRAFQAEGTEEALAFWVCRELDVAGMGMQFMPRPGRAAIVAGREWVC